VALLRAIGTPYAVITDGDPDAGKGKTGAERAAALSKALGEADADPGDLGIFYGEETFEADLFDQSTANEAVMFEALETFNWGTQTKQKIEAGKAATIQGGEFLEWVEARGKGRFAQRLAGLADSLDAPGYVQRALEHVMS
jgi:putative ATP-dependent endonuclease of the OLD family